jgi:UDP-N-acetylglucosamine 2-epimerase (non-hydrolysing)
MKVTIVCGARPNFVKVAAILAAMAGRPEFRPALIHTGQHYDENMSEVFFRDLEILPPQVNLAVGSNIDPAQTAEIMGRMVPVLAADRPDVCLVVGDVNSTVAAALAAAKMGLPVAHVEAGLRSFDRTMPEELNRLLTDAIADWCFTTEPSANDNLRREGVPAERVHHVGNVMIDTLFRFRERAAASTVLARSGVTPGTFAVLTLHRRSNVDDETGLCALLTLIDRVADGVPVVFPVHPRTRARLERAEAAGWQPRSLRPVPPLPYLDFVQLIGNARCVFTDSGGVQEETTALHVPCLTLRPSTERPITVTHGTNRIVGCDAGTIEAAWTEIRTGRWPLGRLPEHWDGKAAERVLDVLAERTR